MSMTMDDSIKRWTAKRKTVLVIEILQGKTTVAEASRSFHLTPSEIEAGARTRSGAWRIPCAPTRRASSTWSVGACA